MRTHGPAPLPLHLTLGTALLLGACGDDGPAGGDASASGTAGGESTTAAGETEAGDDGGEPPPAADADATCDAGDEAWVKRAIPMIQGRLPEGMREVRLLVAMIEQIDAAGGDGREVVARGLASGDLYLRRWSDFFLEQLRVNRIEIKANYGCYGARSAAAESGDLAAFIRDNDPQGADFGGGFTMADVLESALRLDDITPVYRADLFARMARPLTGANVTEAELEVVRRANYGEIFAAAYLGRRMACLECHNSEASVTYSPDPAQNHHWALPGRFEAALFGDAKGRPEAEVFAAFRWSGFVTDGGGVRPWGMAGACGRFQSARGGDLLGDPAYLGGALPADPYLFDIDPLYRAGLKALADEGLVLGDDLEVAPDRALAFLLAANVANQVWREAMGYPLTLATGFPRNQKQREILQELTETFIAERYSVRALVAAIALHPYFNQAAPDACGAPYPLEPVFEPFSRTAADPNVRGNSLGDRVQRRSAWVLLDSAARAMWWDLPQRLSEGPLQQGAFLRDQGVFLKDALPGFNGVDLGSLLSWESKLAAGYDPGLGGPCTGPLGGPCAPYEWIEEMLVAGAGLGDATVGDLAAAIKDRILTEPTIYNDAEAAVIAAILGFDLDLKMNGLPTGPLEEGARRYAGLLFNTPQFLLLGAPSRDQDPAAGPRIAAPGTDTLALCDALAPALLGDAWSWTCAASGVTVSKK